VCPPRRGIPGSLVRHCGTYVGHLFARCVRCRCRQQQQRSAEEFVPRPVPLLLLSHGPRFFASPESLFVSLAQGRGGGAAASPYGDGRLADEGRLELTCQSAGWGPLVRPDKNIAAQRALSVRFFREFAARFRRDFYRESWNRRRLVMIRGRTKKIQGC
jgi:hypothetical protein